MKARVRDIEVGARVEGFDFTERMKCLVGEIIEYAYLVNSQNKNVNTTCSLTPPKKRVGYRGGIISKLYHVGDILNGCNYSFRYNHIRFIYPDRNGFSIFCLQCARPQFRSFYPSLELNFSRGNFSPYYYFCDFTRYIQERCSLLLRLCSHFRVAIKAWCVRKRSCITKVNRQPKNKHTAKGYEVGSYMIYVVNYDLPRGLFGRSPQPLYDELFSSRGWWHYLDKTWLVSTLETMEELYQRLLPHLNETDKILITELTKDYYGQLPQEAWDWISERIQNGEIEG